MQKVCHVNLLRRPEEGKYLLFDPALTKIMAWLTSLPAFQISPLGRGIDTRNAGEPPASIAFKTPDLANHLHCCDCSKVCSSVGVLETGKPLSPRRCMCQSNPHVAATSSCGTQRANQRGLDARSQRTYIHGDSSNRMSPCTCVAMYCSVRACQSSLTISSCGSGVTFPSETSVPLSHTRLGSIRAPPKEREKILVDPGGD